MEPNFGAVDYVVFGSMLFISAAIGVYYRFSGGRQQTTQEYLMADRNMGVLPVAFSLMASFLSAVTLLGVSSEIYSFGTLVVIIYLSHAISTPLVAYAFLPVFFKLQATSANEYLERRFGYPARLAASLTFSLQMVLYMGVVLFAPALALSAVTGISQLAAILTVGAVCTFYSSMGGMKAVLITDVFQAVLMFAAILSVIIKGVMDAGGLDNVWKIAEKGGRIEFLNFNPDPTVRHTWWSLFFNGLLTHLSLYAVNQGQVQRLLTIRTLKNSQRAVWLAWPITTTLNLCTCFAGLIMYARYASCDPIRDGRIESRDQLLPLFVVESMGQFPGMSGLFVAGIFSGSLSTISSGVNALAAVSLEDYIKPALQWCNREDALTDAKSALVSKAIAIFFGIICIGLAFVAGEFAGILQITNTIFGVVGGPLLGLFSLGLFFWSTNQVGVLSGLVAGLSISLWLGFAGPKPPLPYLPTSVESCTWSNSSLHHEIFSKDHEIYKDQPEIQEYFVLYRLSYLLMVVIGFVVTIVVGLVVSAIKQVLRPEDLSPVHPDLLSPLVQPFISHHRSDCKT